MEKEAVEAVELVLAWGALSGLANTEYGPRRWDRGYEIVNGLRLLCKMGPVSQDLLQT